jgi:EAL domain-containing protein (putative c-di-GMP-specific phosphodiesterase class I)
LERTEFRLAWQPLCRSSDGLPITGFEVLLRWDHPTRGLVPPDVFIPVAEACGAISAIGDWVLRQACVEAASWRTPLEVSVNVSPLQVQQGDAFAEGVEQILAESGLQPSRLVLEVTEGVLIRKPERVLAALRRLKSQGVKVALDDFGTGYSSLATLRAFPFDKIKIDRAFITGVAEDGQDAAIVRAVQGLANGLDLPVIAEGVETPLQLAALREVGCQEVQGWLAGRPAPIESFSRVTGRRIAAPVA